MNITQITDRQASTTSSLAYEQLLGSMGSEEFGTTVRDSVLSVVGSVQRLYLFEATGRDDSALQYYFGEPGLVDLFPDYQRCYLRLDPVIDAYRAAPAISNVALLRLRPAQISSSGFRRRIFDDAGIVERVSVIQRGRDAWRVINVARHATDGFFSDVQIGALIDLACLVLPMLPLNRQQPHLQMALTVTQLQERFARRCQTLTSRELEVCARAVAGMGVEATALDLGIANTSVLTYRRRAYSRLGVNSAFELCALVNR